MTTLTITLAGASYAAAQAACGQPGVAAVVEGHAILQDQVDERMVMTDRLAPVPLTGEQRASAIEGVVQQLALEHLLDREAVRLGLSVTDEELAANLAMRPLFWDDAGNFSQQVYERELARVLGTTPEAFEARIRREMAHAKVSDHARDAVTDAEVDAWIASYEDVDLGSLSLLGRDLHIEIIVMETLVERLMSPASVELCGGGAGPEMSGPSPPDAPRR